MSASANLSSIKVNSVAGKALLAAIVAAAITFVYFAGKAGLANSLADQPGSIEMAEYAVRLAGDDPQTHYALAILRSRRFSPENAEISQLELEKAAALSPHNYLIWLVLGEVCERNGDAAAAESAMRRAHQLAPNYAATNWALGNLLYRQGNNAEALPLVKKAANDMQKYSAPAAMLLLHIYRDDIRSLKAEIAESENLIAATAAVLANEKRFDEAVEVWQALPEEKRLAHVESAKAIYAQLVAEKQFSKALFFAKYVMPEIANTTVANIANGSFEAEISPDASGPFVWNIQGGTYPLIAVSNEAFSDGGKSLIFVFNDPLSRTMRAVSQTVAVLPGQTYRFAVKGRAELKSQGSLKWSIIDAKTGAKLADTKPVANAAEWQTLEAEFAVPIETEGIILTTAEAECLGSRCAVNGNIWFDDAKLEAAR